MKLVFVILLVAPIFVSAQIGVFHTFRHREPGDHVLAVYRETRGPFEEPQEIIFHFDHQLRGDNFTAYTLSGERKILSEIVRLRFIYFYNLSKHLLNDIYFCCT